MNITFIPVPLDDSLKIEAAITKSAAFAGTSFDWGVGFAPGGVGQPVALVAAVSALAGTGTMTLTPYESDNDTDYTPCGPGVALTGGGSVTGFAGAAGNLTIPAIVSKRYVRGSLTLAGACTLTLSAWLSPNGFSAAR